MLLIKYLNQEMTRQEFTNKIQKLKNEVMLGEGN